MKNCLYCGKEFEPAKPKAVYCSQKCRTYDFRRKKKEAIITPQFVPKAVKKEMPKGLSIQEQIQWKIDNP